MSVDTRVMLNDIFQPESEQLINARIEYACNKEGHGKHFWKYFFHCDAEPNCTDRNSCVITYLFTEHQLRVLRDWWDSSTSNTNKNKVLKKNLEKSVGFFGTARQFNNNSIEPVYACCVMNESIEHPALKRVYFGITPVAELPSNCINFFEEENFNVPTRDYPTQLDRKKRLKGLVINIRPIIKLCFKRYGKSELKEKDGVYFLYLGRFLDTHPWLKYCKDLNSDCSMVQKVQPLL